MGRIAKRTDESDATVDNLNDVNGSSAKPRSVV